MDTNQDYVDVCFNLLHRLGAPLLSNMYIPLKGICYVLFCLFLHYIDRLVSQHRESNLFLSTYHSGCIFLSPILSSEILYVVTSPTL